VFGIGKEAEVGHTEVCEEQRDGWNEEEEEEEEEGLEKRMRENWNRECD